MEKFHPKMFNRKFDNKNLYGDKQFNKRIFSTKKFIKPANQLSICINFFFSVISTLKLIFYKLNMLNPQKLLKMYFKILNLHENVTRKSKLLPLLLEVQFFTFILVTKKNSCLGYFISIKFIFWRVEELYIAVINEVR